MSSKHSIWLGVFAFFMAVFTAVPRAGSVTLDEYLKKIEEKNPALQAAKMDEEASVLKKEMGDLELSPYLIANYKGFKDERLTFVQLSPLIMGTKSEGSYYGFGITKKFVTGTSLQLMLSENPVEPTTSLGAQPKIYNGSWSFTISQSLWKNFFGRATRLRRNREDLVSRIEKTSARLAALQILASAESAFWNAIYLKKEVQVRRDSLERSKRLFDWTRRRVSNGISQKADLVQVEALQTNRELQLIGAEDDEHAAQRTLKDFLQLDVSSPDIDAADAFDRTRPQLIEGLAQSGALRADAYLSKLQAELQNRVSEEIKDGLRPDVVLEGSYSANGLESTMGKSLSHALDGDHPNSSIGVRLTMDLDFFSQGKVRRSANLTAESARLKSAKLAHESASEVSELRRRYSQLSKRIHAATQLVKLQKSKFDLERRRLENGRSTTFQVITFEQDSAESELMLNKLLTEQRKVEANARLFLRDENGSVQ